MSGTERTEKVKEQIFKMLRECKTEKEDVAGIVHLCGVAYLSAYIAANRFLNTELCLCAGLLHDLWLFKNMPVSVEQHRQHGYHGSRLAEEILRETGLYNSEEIYTICTMILNHNDKHLVHDEYSEVLKDADALQHYLNNSDYDKKYNYHGRIEKFISRA